MHTRITHNGDSKRDLVSSQVCWYTPVIPGLGWLRQEDQEFEANMDLQNETLSQKQKQTNKKNREAEKSPMI
jgi:hypothetical protein